MILSPSVLSADFVILGQQLDELKDGGVSHIHFDMMDGDFVPAISFGPPVLASIAKHYDLYMDVHMMVTEPGRYIDAVKAAGADGITVHAEACRHIDRTLEAIRAAGCDVGVSLNPGTPVVMLNEILSKVDLVLLMSVNPGFGGQSYIPYVTDKIRQLSRLREQRGLAFSIQVDGGVTADNAAELTEAGADNLVAGSAVFKGGIAENLAKFPPFT